MLGAENTTITENMRAACEQLNCWNNFSLLSDRKIEDLITGIKCDPLTFLNSHSFSSFATCLTLKPGGKSTQDVWALAETMLSSLSSGN